MSLPNPTNVITEQRLKQFYDEIYPYLGGGGSGSGGSGMMNYSTEEQVVGTWIDGKPLYQKTIDCGAAPNNTNNTVDLGVSGVNTYFFMNGFAIIKTSSANQVLPISYLDITTLAAGIGILLKVESNVLKAVIKDGANYSAYNVYITIQYTKTTDTAVSV